MKYTMISMYQLQWIKGYQKVFGNELCIAKDMNDIDGSDCVIFMWADETTRDIINNREKICPYIVYIRAFEWHQLRNVISEIKWDRVDKVLCVNDAIAAGVREQLNIDVEVIYNGVIPSDWTWKKRGHGKKIAQVCFINQKKTIPLSLQVLMKLPGDYELHLIGGMQELIIWDYIKHIVEENKLNVAVYHHVPHEKMDSVLEDMNYIISSSAREGSPNNILEGMAKGIKPLVHNWPGARAQFGPFIWNAIDECVDMIKEDSPYQSSLYRAMIECDFGMDNFRALKKITEDLCRQAVSLA